AGGSGFAGGQDLQFGEPSCADSYGGRGAGNNARMRHIRTRYGCVAGGLEGDAEDLRATDKSGVGGQGGIEIRGADRDSVISVCHVPVGVHGIDGDIEWRAGTG